jgi:putative phosphoribosyl transferase
MVINLNPQPITISLQTLHSEDLEGFIVLPNRTEAIVILVQVNRSPQQRVINRWLAAGLNRKGIATLVLDLLPANGRNSGGRRFQLELDLLAQRLELATKWLLRQPATKNLTMGYFGTSIGAAAAIKAAAALPQTIATVVSAGGRPDLAHNILAKILAPTLLIVGEHDHLGFELNQEAYKEIIAEKRLVVIPEATHLFKEPGVLVKVEEAAVDWFKRYLKPSKSILETGVAPDFSK